MDTQRQAGVWAQETQKFWGVKGASRKAREKVTEATVHTLLSAALKALDLQPAPVSLWGSLLEEQTRSKEPVAGVPVRNAMGLSQGRWRALISPCTTSGSYSDRGVKWRAAFLSLARGRGGGMSLEGRGGA